MYLQYLITLLSILYVISAQITTDFQSTTETYNDTKTESDDVTTEAANSTQTQCSVGQWQCNDGSCILNKTLCDGLINCHDSSDEYRSTCHGSDPRPLLGMIFHCTYFWTEYHDQVCPQVCRDAPEFCYYALLAEHGDKNQTLCPLPEYPVNGSYKIMPYPNQTQDNSTQRDFWLYYTCVTPYVMVQKKIHECVDGVWINNDDERFCSEACEVNKNASFTYICPKDLYGSDECSDYVAINTSITVSRALHAFEDRTSDKPVSVDILCSPNKEFHITTDCVEEIDKMQQKFEIPTMNNLTHYETAFSKYKTNDTSKEFIDLVHKFHDFEEKVKAELKEMHVVAEKCDISLDLLLWNLQTKKEREGLQE